MEIYKLEVSEVVEVFEVVRAFYGEEGWQTGAKFQGLSQYPIARYQNSHVLYSEATKL
jgi:hypothetical protein